MYELQVIGKKIISLTGRPLFMVDRDVAELYETETRIINQAVKRNPERFPEDFYFQLTVEEVKEVITQCDNLESLKFNPDLPYGFAHDGCNMLSAVLNTPVAIQKSIQIMRAFGAMERFAAGGKGVKDVSDNPLLPSGWQLHELRQIYGIEGAREILKRLYRISPFGPNATISYYEATAVSKDNHNKVERNAVIAELVDRGFPLEKIRELSGLSITSISLIHTKYGVRTKKNLLSKTNPSESH